MPRSSPWTVSPTASKNPASAPSRNKYGESPNAESCDAVPVRPARYPARLVRRAGGRRTRTPADPPGPTLAALRRRHPALPAWRTANPEKSQAGRRVVAAVLTARNYHHQILRPSARAFTPPFTAAVYARIFTAANTCEARLGTLTVGTIRNRLLATTWPRCACRVASSQPIHASRGARRHAAALKLSPPTR